MASGKPQNLLVPLIVSVVITVATSVTAFLFYQQTTKLTTELGTAKKSADDANKNKTTAEANLRILKEKIGYPDAEFGTPQDAQGGTSLMSKVAEDLQKYADQGSAPSLTFKDELARLALRRDDLIKELTAKTDDYATLRGDFEKKRDAEGLRINEHEKAYQEAHADRELTQKTYAQKFDETERQRQQVAGQAADLAEGKKQVENELERVRTDTKREIDKQSQAIVEYKETLQKLQTSGTPVGAVVSVDNLAKEVYIDRGEADLLPLQTTFSVWPADKRGTLYWKERNEKRKKDAEKELENSNKKNVLEPRLEGGPKAYIEIVAILGPHQAKGRIVMDKYYDPIQDGDNLYSPIWAPGQKKHFALAGRFDMTGKGTDDRPLLIDMIKRQGGIIDAEVKNDGTLDGDVDVTTHWLVKGTMPDETDTTDPQREFGGRIRKTSDELESKAKRLGVEVINQDKLYDFMGFKPHSRKYDVGTYSGGPEPAKRFENPSQSTRPSGVPGFGNPSATTRPSGVPGGASKTP